MSKHGAVYANPISDAWFIADASYMAQFLVSAPTAVGERKYRGCARGRTFASRVLGRLMFPSAPMLITSIDRQKFLSLPAEGGQR
jgi:hypothetical protein